MIKSQLAIRMAERRIKIIDVVRATDIDRSTVTKLYHDKLKHLDLGALHKLCLLFGCNVEGIIRFESDAAEGDGKS